MLEFKFGVVVVALMSVLVRGSEILAPFQQNVTTPALKFSDATQELANVTLEFFQESWCDNACQGPEDSFSVGPNVALFQGEYSETCFNCGYGRLAEMANKTGAVALVWYSYQVPGHEATVFHDRESFDGAAPYLVLELGEVDADKVFAEMKKGQVVRMDLKASENEWDDFHSGPWIAVQIIMSLVSFGAIVAGSGRLFRYFLPMFFAEGKFFLAVVVLSIENMCNLIRLLYGAIDPMWSRMIMPYGIGRFLLTITIPIGLVSTVAILLAWNDMLSATYKKNHKFLTKKSKYIFFMVVVVFCTVDIIFAGLAAFQGKVELSDLSAVVLAVFTLCTAIFTLLYGLRLIKTLKKYSSNLSSSQGASGGPSSFESSQGGMSGEITAAAVMSSSTKEYTQDEFSSAAEEGAISHDNSTGKKSFFKAKSFGISKKKSKRKARADMNYMTKKVMKLAVSMILTALILAMAGQEFVLFTPALRGVTLSLLWIALAAQSYFKIMFFIPPTE